MLCHGAVIDVHEYDHDHHGNGQKRVIVVRDRLDEKRKAVLTLDKSGDCSRPAGNGGNDADRRCCSIDQVSQLGPGDFVFISDGAHNAADRQTVEIVVDKDQNTEADRRQLSTLTGLNAAGRPVAECSTAAGPVHQLHDGAQDDQEDQDTDVPGIRQRGNDAVAEDMGHGTLKVESRIQERSGQNTNKQRAVDFLCHQRQDDSDNRRDQRPEALLNCLRCCHKRRNDKEYDHSDESCDRHPYCTCLVFHNLFPLFCYNSSLLSNDMCWTKLL